MAWTNWGFDGTINEAQWSQMAGLLGNGYVAADSASCAVTAVGGARSVSVAAGTLYGDGVVSVNSGAETVAMTTPVNGQWYVIALRRTWATNTAALVAIAGATTTTTTPTVAPTSFPTMNTSAGVLTDQPIAWAWCNSANTTVVIFDLRLLPMRSQPVSVADAAKRDAKFPAPTQGNQVWRDDLGAVETYFGLYNITTNPGGRDTAGWYVSDRQTGLIPIRPTIVTAVSGSATVNAIGTITFTSVTKIIVQNAFSSKYRNYRIVSNMTNTDDNYINFRFANTGTENTSTDYFTMMANNQPNGTINAGPSAANNQQIYMAWISAGRPGSGGFITDISNPAIATRTVMKTMASGWDTNYRSYFGGGMLLTETAYDGFSLIIGAGSMTGTLTIYGYND